MKDGAFGASPFGPGAGGAEGLGESRFGEGGFGEGGFGEGGFGEEGAAFTLNLALGAEIEAELAALGAGLGELRALGEATAAELATLIRTLRPTLPTPRRNAPPRAPSPSVARERKTGGTPDAPALAPSAAAPRAPEPHALLPRTPLPRASNAGAVPAPAPVAASVPASAPLPPSAPPAAGGESGGTGMWRFTLPIAPILSLTTPGAGEEEARPAALFPPSLSGGEASAPSVMSAALPEAEAPPGPGALPQGPAAAPSPPAALPRLGAEPQGPAPRRPLAPLPPTQAAPSPRAAQPPLPAALPASLPGSAEGGRGGLAAGGVAIQGDVFLDGERVGRWIGRLLARELVRPQRGMSGVDPRATPLWPGAPVSL